MKKLIPALCMLLIAATLMGTSTFAWFSMNQQVTATGMQVKAKAEGGIVIAAYTKTSSSSDGSTITPPSFSAPSDATFTASAAITSAAAELYPTSTLSGLASWYHASSDSVNSAAAVSGSYQNLASVYTLESDGIAYDNTTKELRGQYYLLNKFQIKATDAATYSLWLSNITVTNAGGSSTDLNKSIRIAIKIGGNTYFFAPNYSTGTLYYYNGTARAAWATEAIHLSATPYTQVSTSITSAATDVEVYIYYEGEDDNCKSINAVDISTLTVDLTFTTVAP